MPRCWSARRAARRCSSTTPAGSPIRWRGSGLRSRRKSRSIMPSRQTLTRHCSKPWQSMVDGFDVASAGELGRVAHLGLPISFAGPGKRDQELETAIRAGVTINLESEGEAERALAICEREGLTAKLAVRVNPPFGLKGSGQKMGGLPSQFGVDHDRAPALIRRIVEAGAEWRGLHIFAGSQALHADALIELQRETVALAASIAEEAGHAPPRRQSGRRLRHSLFRQGPAARRRSGGSSACQDLGGAAENPGRHRIRDRAGPLAGRRGGGLSDPDRRPQGEPREDLPGHRRRAPAPARRHRAISASCCAATIRSPSPAASAPSRRRK